MGYKLRKLNQQVMLITGATSGIGLVTARHAARRGAKLMLISRSEPELRELSNELQSAGHPALFAVADVADEPALQEAAERTCSHFGRIDTWFNNSGVSTYGRVAEVPIADQRRVFETNFWGVVLGSRLALDYLCRTGGALINMGSVLSDCSIPLQAMYCASKHAIKGFTDALRQEIEAAHLPISVTLIKPTAIDTPFPMHARNYLPCEPKLPPPLYAPEVVARAVLFAAEHPRRDIVVGGAGVMAIALANLAPRLYDRISAATMLRLQQMAYPKEPHRDGISGPSSELCERSDGRHFPVFERSLYTDVLTSSLLSGVLFHGGTLLSWLRSQQQRR